MSKYDDMLYMKPPKSKKHPSMAREARAAQFAPFSAMVGHDAKVAEVARLTEQEHQLSEEVKAVLNSKLNLICENLGRDIGLVEITYFVADEKKAGGAYVTCKGEVKKINLYEKKITMMDLTVIPIEHICDIKGDIFEIIEECL